MEQAGRQAERLMHSLGKEVAGASVLSSGGKQGERGSNSAFILQLD